MTPKEIAEKIVDDTSSRVVCMKPLYDSVDLGEALIRQAIAATREEDARIFDRDNWPTGDGDIMAMAISPREAAAAIRRLR